MKRNTVHSVLVILFVLFAIYLVLRPTGKRYVLQLNTGSRSVLCENLTWTPNTNTVVCDGTTFFDVLNVEVK